MKIFLGSSSESEQTMRELAAWVERQGHTALTWADPEVFPAGTFTWQRLVEVAHDVDAAVFVFGPDDEVAYRADRVRMPRDNVLIEFGLFTGVLGPARCIVCRVGDAKLPTDLDGLTYITVPDTSRNESFLKLSEWLRAAGAPAEPTAAERAAAEQRFRATHLDGIADPELRALGVQRVDRCVEQLTALPRGVVKGGVADLFSYSVRRLDKVSARIRATHVSISTTLAEAWHTKAMRHYYDANLLAMGRGVTIHRLFLVDPAVPLNDRLVETMRQQEADGVRVGVVRYDRAMPELVRDYVLFDDEAAQETVVDREGEYVQAMVVVGRDKLREYEEDFELLNRTAVTVAEFVAAVTHEAE